MAGVEGEQPLQHHRHHDQRGDAVTLDAFEHGALVETPLEHDRGAEPDLVVTDLSLSGKPGLELVKELAAKHPSLPVLVLSR